MSIHDYGMFTESGNILVGGIVDTAIANDFDYTWVKRSWSYFLKHLLLVKQDLDLFGTLPLKIFGTQLH